MKRRWPVLPMLASLLLTGSGATAQQAPATAPPQASTPAATGQEPQKAGPAKTPDAAAPAKPAAAKGSPQRFEPSERVRPDFDVAFPVDI
jgi:hypothetical protein